MLQCSSSGLAVHSGPWEMIAPGEQHASKFALPPSAAVLCLLLIFNLHIKSQLWPEAVRGPLIQSELARAPGALAAQVQAAQRPRSPVPCRSSPVMSRCPSDGWEKPRPPLLDIQGRNRKLLL